MFYYAINLFFVFVKMISIICKIIINFLKNIQTTWTIISWSELICYGLYLSSINSWRIKYKRIFIQNTVRYCVFNWPFIRRLPKYSITYKTRASFLSHSQDWSRCLSPSWLVCLFSSSSICFGMISLFQFLIKYSNMNSYCYQFVFKMCITEQRSVRLVQNRVTTDSFNLRALKFLNKETS